MPTARPMQQSAGLLEVPRRGKDRHQYPSRNTVLVEHALRWLAEGPDNGLAWRYVSTEC